MNLEWSPSTHWKCIEVVFRSPTLPFDIGNGHASKFHREKVHDIYSLATKALRGIRWMNNQCNLLSETFQFSKTCWRSIFKKAATNTWNSSMIIYTWWHIALQVREPVLYQIGCFFTHCVNGPWTPPPSRFYTIMLRIFLTNCWKVRKRLSRHNLTK